MKVEQEKLKSILLQLEESDEITLDMIGDGDKMVDDKEVFHLLILRDAGFIDIGHIQTVADGTIIGVNEIRMTYQGNEYLQALKESKVWDKIKNFSIGTAKVLGRELLIELAKEQTGLK